MCNTTQRKSGRKFKFWRKFQSKSSAKNNNGGGRPARAERDRGGPLIEDAFTDVHDKYDVDDASELGSGQYGVVRRCTDRHTRDAFAIKSVLKAHVANIEVLREEVYLLKEVSHPNIIKLVDVFEDKEHVHLVQEMCTGGELFDRIVARRESPQGGQFSECEAALIVRQILDAVAYCHEEKNIVHRDLKPENFLFETKSESAVVKVIDFGYATRHTNGQKPMKDEVGTPLYMSPEVMDKKYNRSCDVWSVGVIAYTLLAGHPPFNGNNEKEIYENVRDGKFRFPSPQWDDVSLSAKDFICKVLKRDAKQRITAAEAAKHKWIQEFAPRGRRGSLAGRKKRMSIVGLARRASQRLSMRNLNLAK
mmetsp:Transcript_4996/g.14334  ORF Transcript_4996/g.14334 Transcript_4996/m.14334 type:complete len:363 (-) Transcript_4996:506-1594(-)